MAGMPDERGIVVYARDVAGCIHRARLAGTCCIRCDKFDAVLGRGNGRRDSGRERRANQAER